MSARATDGNGPTAKHTAMNWQMCLFLFLCMSLCVSVCVCACACLCECVCACAPTHLASDPACKALHSIAPRMAEVAVSILRMGLPPTGPCNTLNTSPSSSCYKLSVSVCVYMYGCVYVSVSVPLHVCVYA